MNDQRPVPFVFMRGGTSRGPYMRRADLPADEETLSRVLVSMIGAGHPLNIDGLGGGNPVATKTAMLSASDDDWADIDYFFAQVAVDQRLVDRGLREEIVDIGPVVVGSRQHGRFRGHRVY